MDSKRLQAKPPKSPDLDPSDYSLWGHLKSLVFQTPVQNQEDLRKRIFESCAFIKKTTNIFERGGQSIWIDIRIILRSSYYYIFIKYLIDSTCNNNLNIGWIVLFAVTF